MKLYTERQVRDLLRKKGENCRKLLNGPIKHLDDILNAPDPDLGEGVAWPSEDEIDKWYDTYGGEGGSGFVRGVEWLKERLMGEK